MRIITKIWLLLNIIICICVFSGCSEENNIEYKYYSDLGRARYSIDNVNETSIDIEITPELAAYIAKGVFISIHGIDYVNERELVVYDNTESFDDLSKYGEFYTVSLNLKGYTGGEYIAISKINGEILKVYRLE